MSVAKDSYNAYMSNRGSYAMIPNEIWERKDVSHLAKVVWCYILTRKSDWESSRNNLARNLRIHKDSIGKYVKELESRNLLKKSVGARGSWNFEIIRPGEWAAEEIGPISARANEGPTTEPHFSPDVGCLPVHTQEAIIKTNLANESVSFKEVAKSFPTIVIPEKPTVVPRPTGSVEITPTGILLSWRKQYPQGPGFLSGKKAATALNQLFFNLQKYGFEGSDISKAQVIKLVFGSNPKSKIRAWVDDIENQIEMQRDLVFESPVAIDQAPEPENLSELISPEAVAKYKEYRASGRTPADFNGMSLIDYANMRAYAESFKAIAFAPS